MRIRLDNAESHLLEGTRADGYDRSVEQERLAAYQSAMREAGLRVGSEYVKLGHYYRIDEGGPAGISNGFGCD
jgi:DNA-binding LacI/PurR family transcriptional regulator